MEGIFSMTPLPSGFSKISSQNGPPLLWKFHFCHTHPHSLWKPKLSYFFSARYRILILTFFSKKFGGYCDQHITRRYVAYLKDAYHKICDTKITDLIPSIPLHNFVKTTVTKKFISKTVERKMLKKKRFTPHQFKA